jgi:exodeoxyribonuclease-3
MPSAGGSGNVIKIASFNVNSLRARIGNVLTWLRTANPDVVLLQEIKCLDTDLPKLEIEDLGYNFEAVGQKSYNGVAILSKHPFMVEERRLPGGEGDDHARYIEAVIDVPEGKRHKALRVASIYLPNGNPVATDKFAYKLKWLERLNAHALALLDYEEPLVLGGDYNVAPTDDDVYDPVAWAGDALCRPESRAGYFRLLNLGYVDAFRALHSDQHRYTFWDYQAGRWQRDEGLRIDHLLLSPQAADSLDECDIDKRPRNGDKPSDHTPIWCSLDL